MKYLFKISLHVNVIKLNVQIFISNSFQKIHHENLGFNNTFHILPSG